MEHDKITAAIHGTTPSGTPLEDEAKIQANLMMIEIGVANLFALGAIDRVKELPVVLEVHAKEPTPSKVLSSVADVAVGAKDVVIDSGYVVKHAARVSGRGIMKGFKGIGHFFQDVGTGLKHAAEEGRKPSESHPEH